MKILTTKRKLLLICVALAAILICCKKTTIDPIVTPTTPTDDPKDPLTGAAVTNLTSATGECYISNIAQRNNNYGVNTDNSFAIKRDASFTASRLVFYDSLTLKNGFDFSIRTGTDSIVLSSGEYFIQDKTTKQIVSFTTRADLSDPGSDKMVYQYSYNTAGYLIKKLVFINGDPAAVYQTDYSYSADNVLTGCVLYIGSNKQKFMESSIQFDQTKTVKPWLYVFPDFFEGYNYLQAFNFGKKPIFPLKSIVTNIYDVNDGTTIDSWNTTFTDLVISKDSYLLQITANGDLQQGLGLLFGVTRFDYVCK